ncbi:hypothetical protein COLO4_01187, partial [Corchorus olitorius]
QRLDGAPASRGRQWRLRHDAAGGRGGCASGASEEGRENLRHAGGRGQLADDEAVQQVDHDEGEDRRQIQPAQARQDAAEGCQQRLADLVDQFGGRIVGLGRDPGEDDADDQGKEEHLEEQRGHAEQGPDQQGGEQAADAGAEQHHHDHHQRQLDQHGQHQGRQIDAAEAGNDASHRLEQRLGGAHGELRQRIVEVGPDQLQDEAQQDDQQIETAEGLDDIDESLRESGHGYSLSIRQLGQFRSPVGRGGEGFFHQVLEGPGLEGFDGALGGALGGHHRTTQLFGAAVTLAGHSGGAAGGVQGQLLGDLGRQAELGAGLGHGFHQQEEIGRAAAGDGGDRVQLLFFLDPQGQADRGEDLLGTGALLGADL